MIILKFVILIVSVLLHLCDSTPSNGYESDLDLMPHKRVPRESDYAKDELTPCEKKILKLRKGIRIGMEASSPRQVLILNQNDDGYITIEHEKAIKDRQNREHRAKNYDQNAEFIAEEGSRTYKEPNRHKKARFLIKKGFTVAKL